MIKRTLSKVQDKKIKDASKHFFYLIFTMPTKVDMISLVMNKPKGTKTIIEDLASITRMERGKLTSEYRTRPNPDGNGDIVRGPYFKLQAREDGKNNSRRVPTKEVSILEDDLKNHKKFKDLVFLLENTIISNTRLIRADEMKRLPEEDSKKNSTQ